MFMNFLDRLFGKAEEINGGNRCPTYLYRWIICSRFKSWKAYIHHFVGDDWSMDLHDHPKRFISVGLWGWYLEETPNKDPLHEGTKNCPGYPCTCHGADFGRPKSKFIKYQAPWIRSFPATHIHRLSVPSKNCWTLVIVLRPVREWGFWHLGIFFPWREYVNGKDGIADKMKACD
jgi:hypothetical protein